MELILQWCSSAFSDRHSRARVSLWKRLDYSACGSQESEYFEISFDGKPQIELLILLHIMLLLDDAYQKLDLSASVAGNCPESNGETTHLNGNMFPNEAFNMSKKSLLPKRVCDALLSIADMRESLYGLNSVEDDIEALERCSLTRERKLYHSLVLRINERKILQKLRNYASQPNKINKHSSPRKKLKRTTKKTTWFFGVHYFVLPWDAITYISVHPVNGICKSSIKASILSHWILVSNKSDASFLFFISSSMYHLCFVIYAIIFHIPCIFLYYVFLVLMGTATDLNESFQGTFHNIIILSRPTILWFSETSISFMIFNCCCS